MWWPGIGGQESTVRFSRIIVRDRVGCELTSRNYMLGQAYPAMGKYIHIDLAGPFSAEYFS